MRDGPSHVVYRCQVVWSLSQAKDVRAESGQGWDLREFGGYLGKVSRAYGRCDVSDWGEVNPPRSLGISKRSREAPV